MPKRMEADTLRQHAEYRQMRDARMQAEEMEVDTPFNIQAQAASASRAGRC